MKYEKLIVEVFAWLGLLPRDNQVKHINQICEAFLDEGYHNVTLSAPTGSGKSIIGAVVAEVLHRVKNPGDDSPASFMLSATNVLLDQYMNTFNRQNDTDNTKFFVIKGAGNYECDAMSTPQEPQTAEACAITMFRKTSAENIIQTFCGQCEYQKAKAMKGKARHLILNYAYYFIDRMYSSAPMERRTVSVYDEAHLLNDLFVEHNAIYFSEKRLISYAEEASENLKLANTEIFKNLKTIRTHLEEGKITEKNYRTYLKTLLDTYTAISQLAKAEADRNTRQQNKYLKLMKLSKKYYNLGCKIDDLFTFDYQHVFEYKAKDVKKQQNEHEISVKPVFIGDMFQALDNSEFNLLMSATISEQYVKRTMTLDGKTKHIRLEPHFPPENKKVVFYKPMVLNYNSMKSDDTLKRLSSSITDIVKHHTAKDERGIILAPSFVIAERAAKSIFATKINTKVFEHRRGEKLAEILEKFKAYSSGPAVLITPSGFEGVDLPGSLCRYQIIVKMPYASLGDKRIAHILETFPDVYQAIALKKLVQGAGRGVRSVDDWAITYVLDTAAQKVWQSKANEWNDEFSTSFKSSLTLCED